LNASFYLFLEEIPQKEYRQRQSQAKFKGYSTRAVIFFAPALGLLVLLIKNIRIWY